MRRWHLLSRFRRNSNQRHWDRCVLLVEQLEAREVLSPVVVAPNFGSPLPTPEGAAFTFSGSQSFFAFDAADGGQTYEADLTATNGTISVTPQPGLTVTSNDTAAVTITGSLNQISALLASGVIFQSTAYYSGAAAVTLTVTDLANGGTPGADTVNLKVEPIASDANFSVKASGEVWAPSSGFVFPAGFVSVSPWPDLDGSETVTVTFSLDAANPDAFTLSAGGVALTPLEPGLWQVSGKDPAALRATLNSLVLTPPAGFTGSAFLAVFADIRDQPLDGSSPPDTQSLGFSEVALRFFVGGNVTTPPVFGIEGGSIDLGGRFVASDPDELPGDYHTLTLSVPNGTLTFDSALVPVGVSVERNVAANGSTTILVTGDIAGINQFLATSGSLRYTPGSAYFSGVVPLTITLTNYPGDSFMAESPPSQQPPDPTAAPGKFTGVAALSFVPVAGHVFPSAISVTTNQDTAVALSISVSALADLDGSESVLLVLQGVPTGATLNHGTNLGGGQWALSPSDLAGLTFTPPAGASGTYTLSLKAVVTDSAPDLGLSDSATESTTFTVTVVPAPVTTSPPVVPSLPPASTTPALAFTATTTNTTTSTETTTTTSNTDTTRPEVRSRAVTFDAYSAGANTDQMGATETQVGSSPPAPGSLFAQVEAPLPTYAYGEKHPLPPVLPLDQTLPVAGFSESGGDSFALIDKLYRDAAGNQVSANPTEAAPGASAGTIVAVVWNSPTAPTPTLTAADREPDVVTAKVVPPDAPEDNSRVWAVGFGMFGVLAAWAWLIRGSEGRLTRAVLRFFRTLHRRPTQRTV